MAPGIFLFEPPALPAAPAARPAPGLCPDFSLLLDDCMESGRPEAETENFPPAMPAPLPIFNTTAPPALAPAPEASATAPVETPRPSAPGTDLPVDAPFGTSSEPAPAVEGGQRLMPVEPRGARTEAPEPAAPAATPCAGERSATEVTRPPDILPAEAPEPAAPAAIARDYEESETEADSAPGIPRTEAPEPAAPAASLAPAMPRVLEGSATKVYAAQEIPGVDATPKPRVRSARKPEAAAPQEQEIEAEFRAEAPPPPLPATVAPVATPPPLHRDPESARTAPPQPEQADTADTPVTAIAPPPPSETRSEVPAETAKAESAHAAAIPQAAPAASPVRMDRPAAVRLETAFRARVEDRHPQEGQPPASDFPKPEPAAVEPLRELHEPAMRRPEPHVGAGTAPELLPHTSSAPAHAAPLASNELPSPPRPAAPPEAAAAPEPPVPSAPSAPPREPVREIAVRVPGSEEKVEIRVAERSGEIRLSVHAADSELRRALRDNLPELVGGLEERGFSAEAWRTPDRELRAEVPEQPAGEPSREGGHHGPPQDGRRRRQGRSDEFTFTLETDRERNADDDYRR